MLFLTFYGSNKIETAQTTSMAGIATHLSIEKNYKTLLLNTKYNDTSLQECFWDQSINIKLKGDLETGIGGLIKAIASNKTSPEIITNYTRTIFKERLEVISGLDAKIYLFASANLLNVDTVEFMKLHNVYMVCLGLEDITVNYAKNKELDSDISILEDKINVLDNKLKSLEDSSYVVNKDKINLENIIKELDFNIDSINNSLEETKASLEGTKHIVDNTLSNEEERVINAYYQKVKERDEVNNLLINLNKKRDTLNASLEEYEASIKSSNSIYKEKSERLKNLEIEVNRADVKLDNLLNTLNEVYALTYEKAKENYILEIEDNIARSKVNSLKREIKDLGVVNIGAIEEYERVNTRYSFLTKQKEDLVNAENMLLEIINEMDSIMISEFAKTFEIVNNHFKETFRELFKGGSASLKLTDPNNLLETGIEIIASPPGKKLTSINLLSGGEKTFTAISLLFAILKSRPVPFCILDEVEAALDEVNVASFGEYLLKLKDKTQFILITHKKKTMEYADILYGITMQESGVSKLVSVKLEEMNE